MSKHRILVIGELYKPLIPWFHFDEPPQGVPAVYNLFNYLGNSDHHSFKAIMVSPEIARKKEFPNGSYIKLFQLKIGPYYIWKLVCFFVLLFKAIRELKRNEYDYIYGLSTYALVAALAGKISKVPSIGRIFGTILTNPVRKKKWFKIYTRFFFDWLAIKIPCDLVIATRDGTQYGWVSQQFGGKGNIKLLVNGMDHSIRSKLLKFVLVKNLKNKSTINLCYISRLEYYKRPQLGIEIIKKLLSSSFQFHLTIVGSGSLLSCLTQSAHEEILNSCISFIPEMSHIEIVDFIQSQDIALFLYEGGNLGNTLWECGLGGRVIVTTNTGSTGDIIQDGINGLVADDNFNLVDSLSVKILNLVEQSDIEPMTARCREDFEKLILTWQDRFDMEFQELIPNALSKSNTK